MKAEHYVKNIVLETKALYLTQLKVRMDTKGNVYNMHQLVFRDIKSVVVRDEILTHIATQAKIARDRMHASARLTNMVRPRWRKVLSDVDDTLCSSGGHFPAGCDASYSKHTVYPGLSRTLLKFVSTFLSSLSFFFSSSSFSFSSVSSSPLLFSSFLLCSSSLLLVLSFSFSSPLFSLSFSFLSPLLTFCAL